MFYDWALQLNEKFKQLITNGDHYPLIHHEILGKEGRLAVPTPEHYLPLLYTIALQGAKDTISFFNDKAVGGSLTITSVNLDSR